MSDEILDNPRSDRVRHVASLEQGAVRRRYERFLVEGPQAVREAVAWAADQVIDVYADHELAHEEGSAVHEIVLSAVGKGLHVHEATDRVMARISPDCQGIAAVVATEAVNGVTADDLVSRVASAPRPLVAACWQVRDPGNVGTIIRAADAAGCAAVVLVDKCVDPLNPKVVRATAGSLFHIPVIHMDTDDFFDWAVDNKIRTAAADVRGTAVTHPLPLPALAARQAVPRAVLFGNEARGLPASLIDRCDEAVSIPIYGKAESLNVAMSAAVILYALAMADGTRR